MKKIAIVEDDFLLALVMKKHLQNEGYTCFSFSNAADFFAFFKENNELTAVILDVKIKGEMSGLELFHNFSSFSKIPVMFSTGNSDLKELKSLKTDQVKGILIKPISLDDLTRTLNQLD